MCASIFTSLSWKFRKGLYFIKKNLQTFLVRKFYTVICLWFDNSANVFILLSWKFRRYMFSAKVIILTSWKFRKVLILLSKEAYKRYYFHCFYSYIIFLKIMLIFISLFWKFYKRNSFFVLKTLQWYFFIVLKILRRYLFHFLGILQRYLIRWLRKASQVFFSLS